MQHGALIAIFALAPALAGCDALVKDIEGRYNLRNCEFAIDSVTPSLNLDTSDLAKSTIDLTLSTGVFNPNDAEVILDRMDFDLFIDDQRFATGRHEAKLAVPAGAHQVFPITAALSYRAIEAASPALWDAMSNKTATYRIEATVYVDTPLGPFDFTTTITEGRL